MTQQRHPSNVIRFPVEAVSKRGFKRAAPPDKAPRTRGARMEREGQMNLFEAPPPPQLGEVVPLPLQMSPFEEALLLDEQGDAQAVEAYLNAIEEEDCEADAWCNLGVIRSTAGDLETAFDCFASSLAAEPRHAEPHYNIGNLYFEMGDYKLARTHYELAIDINPEFPSAFFNLGLVTALTEDYAAARVALLRYKALTPVDSDKVADELLGYITSAIHLC